MTNTKSLRAALAALPLAAVLAATGANASGCPAESVLTEPRQIEIMPDVGVDRPILTMIDLTGWRGQGNFLLRTRRLTIAPDGIVPTHWHDDRPAILYMLEGELIEHNSFCAVPIVFKAGDYAPEFGPGYASWWENKSGKSAIILSSDVVPFEMKDDKHM